MIGDWASCSSIWMRSRTSTTRSATRPATGLSRTPLVDCRASCAHRTRSAASVATSSWCCCPISTVLRKQSSSRARCCSRCPARAPTTRCCPPASGSRSIHGMRSRVPNWSRARTRRCTAPRLAVAATASSTTRRPARWPRRRPTLHRKRGCRRRNRLACAWPTFEKRTSTLSWRS